MAGLKSVDQHLADILDGIEAISPLDLQLLDAHGCILTEAVTADHDLPMFDNSSMDGYAVRLEDVASASEASPVQLPVIGDIAAGAPPTYTVQTGMSVRIMTGALVPPGAEAVVPLEWTDGGIAAVSVRRAPSAGAREATVEGPDDEPPPPTLASFAPGKTRYDVPCSSFISTA